MEQQRQYLRATLKDSDTEASDAAAMVQAWQRGDSAELERQLRKESAKNPELFHVLTIDRNRQLVAQNRGDARASTRTIWSWSGRCIWSATTAWWNCLRTQGFKVSSTERPRRRRRSSRRLQEASTVGADQPSGSIPVGPS